MKKLLVLCSVVVMLIGLTAFNAAAAQINGDISFAGNTLLDSTDVSLATKFITFSSVLTTSGTGDYFGLGGLSATFTPFQFSGATPTPTPFLLWTFTSGNTYSFSADNFAASVGNAGGQDYLAVGGTGTASITGKDPTPGFYIITANSAGTTFSFSASSGAAAVPEPGTLLLLGFGLVGLVGAGRKFKK